MSAKQREISIRNAHPRLRLDRHAVARVIHLLDNDFLKSPLERGLPSVVLAKDGGATRRGVSPVPPGELSLVFLTDPALAKIHADFMDDPTVTDVITFEGNPALEQAGEICVSADTAARFVLAGRRPRRPRPASTRACQSSFSAELTLYLVHGWLHLAGYDDLQPAKKRRMRAAEKRAMGLLAAAKAVPVFQLK